MKKNFLKIRTLNISSLVNEYIMMMVDNDIYPSRSEFFRIAINKQMEREIAFYNKLKELTKDKEVQEKMKIITVNLTDVMINDLKELTENTIALVPSVSEMVRRVIYRQIEEDLSSMIPELVKKSNKKTKEKKKKLRIKDDPTDEDLKIMVQKVLNTPNTPKNEVNPKINPFNKELSENYKWRR